MLLVANIDEDIQTAMLLNLYACYSTRNGIKHHQDPHISRDIRSCIVSLHGAGGTPEKQIDWWAGTYNKQTDLRLGQASRHGYIVIAPTTPDSIVRDFWARFPPSCLL